MRLYAEYDESGYLKHLIRCEHSTTGVEITEEEYSALIVEIKQKADYVNRLYNGEITLTDVPAEWQEEIQQRLDERNARMEAAQSPDAEISDREAIDIITGVIE